MNHLLNLESSDVSLLMRYLYTPILYQLMKQAMRPKLHILLASERYRWSAWVEVNVFGHTLWHTLWQGCKRT